MNTERTHRTNTLFALVAVSVASMQAAACAAAPDPPPASRTIRISTGLSGGNSRPISEELKRLYESRMPGTRVELLAAGFVPNLTELQSGSADMAFAFADTAYASFEGRLTAESTPFPALRAIVLLRTIPLHVVVRRDSQIDDVPDLRGRLAASGVSAARFAVPRVLDAYGLDPKAILKGGFEGETGLAALEAGHVDALFVLSRYPSEQVRRAAAAGARLLPLTGEHVERFLREYPFYGHTTVPAGTYANQSAALQTVGINNILTCRGDLDEQLVYDLTRVLFETIDETLPVSGSPLDWFDTERPEATPIPLHPGAARYYRERGLSR